MTKLHKKVVLMIAVEILCLALLGSFLFRAQTELSLQGTHADMQQKLAQLPTLCDDAQDSAAQVTASYDEVYQSKANALAFMAARTEGANTATLEGWRSLLNVNNALLLDRNGEVLARAKVSPADFTRARYNQLRSTPGGVAPAPFEVTYQSGSTYRYYAARVDANTLAVIEQDPAELNGLLDDTGSWRSILSNVSVGLDGFAFGVSARNYNFTYYPDESLIGRDALNYGVDAAALEEGRFTWLTLNGQRHYCGVTLRDDTYLICAVSESEINASRNMTVAIILFVFFIVISIVILYAILLLGAEKNNTAEEENLAKLGGFYFDKPLGRRIGSVALIGLVCILGISLYMQTLYSLSRHSMSNNMRVEEVENAIANYYSDRELIQTQYDRRYLNKAKTAAYILSNWPELADRDGLTQVSRAVGVEWVMIFDETGTSTASNSPYGTFQLSSDPDDQSYEFRKLLNGAPYLLQAAQQDELTGEYRQYIGYQLLNEEGSSGFVQIAVTPSKLEEALAGTSIGSILDGIKVGTNGFAFAVDKEDKTFAYYPGGKLNGRSALDYGMTEQEFSDAFCNYLTVNGQRYYGSALESNNYYVYVVVPAEEVTENSWPITLGTALFSGLCLALVYLLLSVRRSVNADSTQNAEDAAKAGDDGATFDIKTGDGRVKKTESAAARWSNATIKWNEKSPEQQVMTVLKGMLAVLSLIICLAVAFRDSVFDKSSIFIYILEGGWQRGLNIFAFTAGLLMLCVVMVVSMVLRELLKVLEQTLDARGETICRLLRSFVKYLSVIVAMYYCLALFGVDTATLLASAGILSLVIGLGANTLVSDIIAGLFIIFEGEFRVGDIVTVGGWRGTVQEIGVRTTKIEDGAKNVKIISNRDVNGIINMTRKFSFAVCDVGIEYGESLERVENVLAKELPNFKKRIKGIENGPFYKGVVELGSSSVNIRIVAECSESARFQLVRDLNREVKLVFDRNNINIPFPQVVVNQPIDFGDNDEATALEKHRADAFNKQQANLSKDIVEGNG